MADPGYTNICSPSGLAHIRHTVLWRIVPELFFFTAVAAAVVYITENFHSLQIATTLVTVFGSVLGFLVTFRTSSAYSSYQEGRRHWSSIILATRSFARVSWLHVPNAIHPPADYRQTISDDEVRKALVEKTSAIKLLGAFAVALKHYCRGEAGIWYEDLYPLVCYLPKYRLPAATYIPRPDLDACYTSEPTAVETLSASAFAAMSSSTPSLAAAPLLSRNASLQSGISSFAGPSGLHSRAATYTSIEVVVDPQSGNPRAKIKSPHKLLPPRNPPPFAFSEYIPFYHLFADLFRLCLRGEQELVERTFRTKQRRRKPLQVQKDGDNVPLEITLLLSGWVAQLQRRKAIDVPTTNSLLAGIQALQDALTGLERVLLSPIPLQYSLHLRHIIWIYLALLPSQLHASFGWLTVPAEAICTFAFLGILQLGQELDNPLGYDASDLDLENYTNTILREMRELVAHPTTEASPEAVFFVDTNLPFATGPEWVGMSAVQIMEEKVSIESVWSTLKQGGGKGPEVAVPGRRDASEGKASASS